MEEYREIAAPRMGSAELVDARATILTRLREDAPEMGELYEIGLGIVSGEPREAHKYLLAHTMREIRARLPAYYNIANANPRLEYPSAVELFRGGWVEDVRPQLLSVTETTTSEAVTVSRRTASEIDTLVQRHEQIPIGIRELYLALSERINPSAYPGSLVAGTLEQWLEIRLQGMAHIPGPTQRSFSLQQCLDAWHIMEQYLFYLLAPAHITYAELDSILEDANSI